MRVSSNGSDSAADVAGSHGKPDAIPAAFFDVDNTIIRGASAFWLAQAMFTRRFFTIFDIVRFSWHQVAYMVFGENKRRIAAVRRRALAIVAGRSVAELTALGEEVYDEVLAHRIFPGTKALLDAHLAAGHQVWLITATPSEVGELIARRLGATGALATVAETKFGFYTGHLKGEMMHGVVKAQSVEALAQRENLDLSQSYAYGDSINDLDLLETVGHPSAINPDPRLRLQAMNLGWPVRDFRKRRPAARRSLQAAYGAGALWAAVVAQRAVRRWLRGAFRR